MSRAGSHNLLVARLRAAQRRWLIAEIAIALCRIAVVMALTALLLAGWEILFRPSIFSRHLTVYGICLPLLLVASAWWLRQAIAGKRLRNAAQRIQDHFPHLGGRLVCGLDLLYMARTPLVAAAIQQVEEEIAAVDFNCAVSGPAWRRSAAAAAISLTALAIIVLLWPDRLANALERLFAPAAVDAAVGAVRLLELKPGDVEIVEGAAVNLQATVDRPAWVRAAWAEVVAIAGEGQAPKTEALSSSLARRALAQTGDNVFSYTLCDLRATCRYRVCIGDTISPWHTINVLPRPAVIEVSGQIKPPAYTGLPPFTLPAGEGNIRAAVGSEVALLVRASQAVREGRLHFSYGAEAPLATEGEMLRGNFTMTQSGFYTISLVNNRGYANVNPPPRLLEAMPDMMPRVRLVKPGRGGNIGLGEEILLQAEARDDYGLREVRICFRRNRLGEVQTLQTWTVAGRQVKSLDPTCRWRIAQPDFDVGDEIACFAEASDLCPAGERMARSSPLVFTVVDRQKTAREKMTALEKAQRRLADLLAEQKVIHRATADFLTTTAEFFQRAAKIRGKQAGVRAGVIDVAAELAGLEDSVGRRIRAVLRGLAATELIEAVAALDDLAQAADEEARRAATVRAMPPQAEVIRRLGEIFGILPALKESLTETRQQEKGADLKSPAAETMAALKDNLERFKETQRKAVDTAAALSKKPMEDFTEKDRQQISEMRAAEEDWAKFLRETASDLSRLPPQDFSNPAVAADLLAILEEVEIAADAMQRLEMTIATAAASTALELAEQLTTHLEKWLPDAPDRIAWRMEEPLADYEIPMAELPDKLEDIVGDLLEQEEELMREAEDESSSWADSIDKGAGWDALDGPISNYSAQGVTGNQLPNDTEISGRAGQGRQGKSHGEMVSDTAVDKDGRRTPSRLTSAPFEKGRIDDKSTKAGGGATGGGKEGGMGGRGLEGQAPAPDKQPATRLQGRQADLRNQAERLQLSLNQLGYNTALLENTLLEFRTIEDELKNGRYRNASRRAQYAIAALRAAKDDILGQAEVRLDRAAGLPRDLQREIVDAFEAGLPKGYEDIIHAYYQKLAEQEGR